MVIYGYCNKSVTTFSVHIWTLDGQGIKKWLKLKVIFYPVAFLKTLDMSRQCKVQKFNLILCIENWMLNCKWHKSFTYQSFGKLRQVFIFILWLYRVFYGISWTSLSSIFSFYSPTCVNLYQKRIVNRLVYSCLYLSVFYIFAIMRAKLLKIYHIDQLF